MAPPAATPARWLQDRAEALARRVVRGSRRLWRLGLGRADDAWSVAVEERLAALGQGQDRLAQGQDRLAQGQDRLLALAEGLETLVRQLQAREEDPGAGFMHALHRVGVLNYENGIVSGEWRFLDRYFRAYPDAVVLDVGANEGQFATLARQFSTQATIHCFEPHPRTFAILEGKAGVLAVTLHQLALSDGIGTAEFYDYRDQQGSQHASLYRDVIERVHGRPASAVTVRCEALDGISAGLGLHHVGLLKIDTEGHELAVLKGARGLIERGAVDVIQFEFNEMNVISRVFMKDYFDLLPGYSFFRLLADGVIRMERYDPRTMEIFAYQNIVCIRKDLDPAWLLAP